jgi:peptidyl-prolyl cis-trans isomerase C
MRSAPRSVPIARSLLDARSPTAKRWLREPVIHFLVIGVLLFVAYSFVGSGSVKRQSPNRIELTEDDLRQIDAGFTAHWLRHPTAQEMASLVDEKIREEVLYREALALGLDKEDTIVKRRLAQKMEFLAEDVSALREPQINELKDWFGKNSQRFALPSRIWFHHVYFSFDRKGEEASKAAARAYKELAGEPVDSAVATRAADPFMFQDYFADCTEDQVAKTFGSKFAKALFQLPCSSWQGPIESGLGWHLVWVDSMTPTRVPAFEEVQETVKTEWQAEQSAEANRRAFAIMRARYEVVLPDAVTKDSATAMVKKGTP